MKAITTRYLPASSTLPARIVAKDGDGNRLILSYEDTALGDTAEQAHTTAAYLFCKKMDWEGRLVTGWLEAGTYVHVFVGQ